MGGLNTTGTPNTGDYELGRGRLFFALLNSDGTPKAYRDLGNAPKVSFKVETTELEHRSSRIGVKYVDKTVTVETKASGSIELDEMNFQNLALFMQGSAAAAQTNGAVAGFTEYAMITTANGGVELGRWYDIVNSSGVRCYDITAADLTVEKSGSPDTALVKDTDYLLDADMGRIFFLTTGVVIVAGDQIDGTLAAKAGAKTLDVVNGMTASSIHGALKFLSLNPASDDVEKEYQFHDVVIRPSGDFDLIGDSWQSMKLEYTAQKSNFAGYATHPYVRVVTHSLANNDE